MKQRFHKLEFSCDSIISVFPASFLIINSDPSRTTEKSEKLPSWKTVTLRVSHR